MGEYHGFAVVSIRQLVLHLCASATFSKPFPCCRLGCMCICILGSWERKERRGEGKGTCLLFKDTSQSLITLLQLMSCWPKLSHMALCSCRKAGGCGFIPNGLMPTFFLLLRKVRYQRTHSENKNGPRRCHKNSHGQPRVLALELGSQT